MCAVGAVLACETGPGGCHVAEFQIEERESPVQQLVVVVVAIAAT